MERRVSVISGQTYLRLRKSYTQRYCSWFRDIREDLDRVPIGNTDSIATDGAQYMTDKKQGFVGLLTKDSSMQKTKYSG